MWFGGLLFFLFVTLLKADYGSILVTTGFLSFMGLLGFIMFKKMVWDLADEVYDNVDSLIFRKGRVEQIVELKDIINIDYAHLNSPERVVIHTRKKGEIGNELAFSLPMRFNLFKKSPYVRELIERVDKSKNT